MGDSFGGKGRGGGEGLGFMRLQMEYSLHRALDKVSCYDTALKILARSFGKLIDETAWENYHFSNHPLLFGPLLAGIDNISAGDLALI